MMKAISVLVVLTALTLFLVGQTAGTNASNLRHARTVVVIEENQNYFATLTWNVPFSNTNYTVTCTPVASVNFQGAGQGVYLFQVTNVATTSVQVEVAAEGGTGPVYIDCIAVQD
jgi:hypothetical protein